MTGREGFGLPVFTGDHPTPQPVQAHVESMDASGLGLFHQAAAPRWVRFALPGELVEAVAADNGGEYKILHVLEPSPDRVAPPCPHFGPCGGCQLQMLRYDGQLNLKASRLTALLGDAGLHDLPQITIHSAEPYGYRDRIRLRVETVEGTRRLGFNQRGTTRFLPIEVCPISAPPLLAAAQALIALAATDRDAAFWVASASELEIFCNEPLTALQITLLCAPRTKAPQGSLDRVFKILQRLVPELAGIGAIASDPRTGPTGRTLAETGKPGLNYRVGDETYWITRGGFFQVNRFLLPELVSLVTAGRSGTLAWDLFAGVGLFSRVLARNFSRVTAVEASPTACADLRSAMGRLARLGTEHTAVEATTLDFLRRAVTGRERPDLVVLDPPRAGAGVEACDLLGRLRPQGIVYVSCDPQTLARDLSVLQPAFHLRELHLLDLFPQTSHLEAVAVLEHRA